MGTKMSNDSARQHLFGTWKLITAVREEISTGTKTQFLGPNPVGYINYGPDGRMLVLTVGSGRPKPAGAKATSTEVEALFRSMTSYGGTYTIDGNEITHHVDVSWNESWTGTDQKRVARFEGNRVYLSTTPLLDPLTGTMTVRTMTWEKLG
jgi:lipocalin-like protein